jgi:uncharacterized short protein YbdD (DUF466 family)
MELAVTKQVMSMLVSVSNYMNYIQATPFQKKDTGRQHLENSS